MKTIFTNGEFILGPYTTIEDRGESLLVDGKEIIDKQIIQGWEQETVADDYVHPVWLANQNKVANDQQTKLRAKAYVAESDALFFKSQRGEIDVQVWLDKVAEIKRRYPYADVAAVKGQE